VASSPAVRPAQLTGPDVLQLWEGGWSLSPLRRAVLLAARAVGGTPDSIATWPVGSRDAALWALRAQLFGTELDAVASCQRCTTEVEFRFDQNELLTPTPDVVEEVHVSRNGRAHLFRTPTSTDLAAALAVRDEPPAGVLVRRCLVDGDAEAFADDPQPVLDAWEAADPLADVTIGLSCPQCAKTWDEPLDIAAFLWSELDSWCRRTLVEVHDLARAYGWSERDVLRLSPWRRQCYLGLVTT
jgi:hypothetical protein